MNLTIHRGTHTIGGSCVEFEAQGHRLVVDLGMPLMNRDGTPFEFVDQGLAPSELVRDGLLPDIDGLYADCGKPTDIHLLISHAHQDHWGLARFVHSEVPVYATEGTIRLLRVNEIFLPWLGRTPYATGLPMWKPVQIGPFEVTTYLADHSAPDAASFLIEAEGKRVFYSGDLRAHGRKAKVFERLVADPPRDIDILLLEGTMISRPDPQEFPDETAVEEALIEMLRSKARLALTFCSGQNIDRIVSIYRAVLQSNSLFVLDLYTAFVLDQLRPIMPGVPQFEWDRVRVFYWGSHAKALDGAGHGDFMLKVNQSRIKKEELLDRRAEIIMLARANAHFEKLTEWVSPDEGMELIWSMWPGYLTDQSPVSRYAAVSGESIRHIHTSGHATVQDLHRLAVAFKPTRLIPMHTSSPQAFLKGFDHVCILDDGKTIEV